jgi:hypothetical protein
MLKSLVWHEVWNENELALPRGMQNIEHAQQQLKINVSAIHSID